MAKAEYYITDGNKFIKQSMNGQFSIVSNISLADVWDKAQVAKAVLDNSVPKAWRSNFFISKLENGALEKSTLSQSEKIQKRIENTATDKTKLYTLDLYDFNNDDNVQKYVSAFENIQNILENSKKTEEILKNRLQALECAFEDLEHHHLKKKLGTVDAYKRDRLESKILLERRSIKTQLEILHKINQYHAELNAQVNDICKTINIIRDRRYIPRVLIGLFENDDLDIDI